MTNDLVARLRKLDAELVEDEDCGDFSCVEEAVDEIERLRKELAAMREERDEARLQTQRILNEIGLAGHNEAAADEENDLDPPRGGQWVDDGSDDDDEKSDRSWDFNIT